MGAIQFLVFIAGVVIAVVAVWQFGLHRDQHGEVIGLHPGPIVLAIIVVFAAILVNSSFGEIGAGERGVVKRFGAVTGQVLNPGLYTIIPVINSVTHCNVQVRKYDVLAEAVSNNMQDVHTNVTLNFHQRPEECVRIVRDLNNDLQTVIIVPGIQESVKAATAQYSAQQLISLRPAVRDAIEKFIAARLDQFGGHADALSITQFQFSPEYTKAIEQKAVVEQQVQQETLTLQRVAIEAQQKVKQAQAEAEATVLNAQANAKAVELAGAAQARALEYQMRVVTPELVRLRQVEALKAWVERWDGKSMPQTVIGQSGGVLPFLNLPGGTVTPSGEPAAPGKTGK